MFWEILKASKGLPVTDHYAALWGKKIAGGWKVTEITGELPLIFRSNGSVLVDYRIYGTSAGAGVETENLWNFEGKEIGQSTEFVTDTFTLKPNTTYTMSSEAPLYNSGALITFGKVGDAGNTSQNGVYEGRPITRTTDSTGVVFVGLRTNNSDYDITQFETCLVEGSTAPTSYIPHGYKLPLTVESGETENLFDKDAKDTSNGYVSGSYLIDGGGLTDSTAWEVSEYIEINPNTIYTIVNSSGSAPRFCQYDENKQYLASERYANLDVVTFTSGSNSKYIRLSKLKTNDVFMLIKGSTSPGHYIPHRYTSDIPIYIGSTKLGEEEYADFGEQKVYKYAEPLKIYGWHVDPSISDSANAITYLGDAVGKTPAAMGSETFSYGDWSDAFFMPKPCMVKSEGTVDYYLDPNDYAKKADGTASDIADPSYDGNAMMEWPLIWWKYEAGETEGEGYFYVANRKPDDTYHCWCNYDADDNITEHFYTAIYNSTGTNKMRSISGVALTSANGNGSTTATQEITRATANNTTDKTEWYIDVWSDRMLINGLLILIGKSLNSQAVFGRGLDTGSQSAKEAYVTGSLNDKGLFWGNTSAGTSGVKVFGMENYWGCVWHRTAGLIGLSNGNTAYKLTYGTADGTTADSYNTNGNGYLIDSTARPASGYFKTAKFGKFGYLPLTTGGSSTTYFANYWYTNNSALTFALVGGSANSGVNVGCSYFNLNSTPGNADWNLSSSLSFKPLAKTVPEPDLIPTDPPVPLPPIPTYKGENTLSSTETLGEVTVKGRIKEVDN